MARTIYISMRNWWWCSFRNRSRCFAENLVVLAHWNNIPHKPTNLFLLRCVLIKTYVAVYTNFIVSNPRHTALEVNTLQHIQLMPALKVNNYDVHLKCRTRCKKYLINANISVNEQPEWCNWAHRRWPFYTYLRHVHVYIMVILPIS